MAHTGTLQAAVAVSPGAPGPDAGFRRLRACWTASPPSPPQPLQPRGGSWAPSSRQSSPTSACPRRGEASRRALPPSLRVPGVGPLGLGVGRVLLRP